MGGVVFDREFSKSLMIHDFDDVLDMWIFSYYTHYYKKKIAMQDL